MSPTPPVFSNHGLRHSGGIERYLLTLVGGLHARGIRPVVVARRFDAALPEYGWVEPVRIPTSGRCRRAARPLVRPPPARPQAPPRLARRHRPQPDGGGRHRRLRQHAPRLPGGDGARRRPARPPRDRPRTRATSATPRWSIAHRACMAAQVERTRRAGREASRCTIRRSTRRASTRWRGAPARAARRARPAARPRGVPARLDRPRRKGLDLLVRTLGRSELPVLLAVAGRPVDVQAPNLRYLGYRSDIEDVYRAVDCTVMASRFEPFGLVGVESVLCGTPVIGARGMGSWRCCTATRRCRSTSTPGSLDAAVGAALARRRAGTLALREPRRCARLRPVGRRPPRRAARLGGPPRCAALTAPWRRRRRRGRA